MLASSQLLTIDLASKCLVMLAFCQHSVYQWVISLAPQIAKYDKINRVSTFQPLQNPVNFPGLSRKFHLYFFIILSASIYFGSASVAGQVLQHRDFLEFSRSFHKFSRTKNPSLIFRSFSEAVGTAKIIQRSLP